jgi:hypothetical protein
MGAFILAGMVFVATILLSLLTLLGNGMSDNVADNNSGSFIIVFAVGTIISVLILGSHWAPNIGW